MYLFTKIFTSTMSQTVVNNQAPSIFFKLVSYISTLQHNKQRQIENPLNGTETIFLQFQISEDTATVDMKIWEHLRNSKRKRFQEIQEIAH